MRVYQFRHSGSGSCEGKAEKISNHRAVRQMTERISVRFTASS
jgi:hypothetical protein